MKSRGLGKLTSPGKVLSIHEFLTLQGYKLPPVMILKDIMSMIALIKDNCHESDASRDITICYFWAHHSAEVGDVIIQHCPTGSCQSTRSAMGCGADSRLQRQ